MRYNLKNFPYFPKSVNVPKDNSGFYIVYLEYKKQVYEWVKGFEEELKKMLEGFQEAEYEKRIKYPTSERQIVKEILGE